MIHNSSQYYAIFSFLSLFLSAFLLNACGSNVQEMPRYEDRIEIVQFGPWMVDHCSLAHKQMDVLLRTDGRLSNNALRVVMTFKKHLRTAPSVRLNTLNVPLYVEGEGKNFSFTIPYNPSLIATLQQDYTYLFIRFYPSENPQPVPYESYFATSGLADGLAYLERTCKKSVRFPWQ